MKTSHKILTLLLVALAATFAFAGDGSHVERHVELAIAGEAGEEPLVIEAGDLAVGDTRQFFTESGKEVLLTRTEDGYDLEVDGKKIDVGMPGGGHHTFETGDAKRVFVFSGEGEDGAEGEHVFIHHGEEGYEWVQDGGENVGVRVLRHGRPSALEHLRAKGILDELDEATRRKIVEALEELEPGAAVGKSIMMIQVDEKVHEIHGDGAVED